MMIVSLGLSGLNAYFTFSQLWIKNTNISTCIFIYSDNYTVMYVLITIKHSYQCHPARVGLEPRSQTEVDM